MSMKRRILVLCTGNTARTQMAEGLFRALGGDGVEVVSAGTNPSYVHPLAIEVMGERGIDISHHRSKSYQEFLGQPFDDVITVCDAAAEACPAFPGRARRQHWSLPDPVAAEGTLDERRSAFRQVRDSIASRVQAWLAAEL
jgi:arsenate reductase (thioredoxin)